MVGWIIFKACSQQWKNFKVKVPKKNTSEYPISSSPLLIKLKYEQIKRIKL